MKISLEIEHYLDCFQRRITCFGFSHIHIQLWDAVNALMGEKDLSVYQSTSIQLISSSLNLYQLFRSMTNHGFTLTDLNGRLLLELHEWAEKVVDCIINFSRFSWQRVDFRLDEILIFNPISIFIIGIFLLGVYYTVISLMIGLSSENKRPEHVVKSKGGMSIVDGVCPECGQCVCSTVWYIMNGFAAHI